MRNSGVGFWGFKGLSSPPDLEAVVDVESGRSGGGEEAATVR